MERIKNHQQESRYHQQRSFFAFILLLVGSLILIGRLAYLQIYHYDKYHQLSNKNSIRLLPIPPPRGLIRDRNGVVLAENIPGYSIDILPEQAGDLNKTLQRLTKHLQLSTEEIQHFHKKRKKSKPFAPISLRLKCSENDMAIFALYLSNMPGVQLNARLIRHYPYQEYCAHAVGYVGRLSEKDAQLVDQAIYQATSIIGKTGIEHYYEDHLHGIPGVQQVEVDAHGRMIKILKESLPTPGLDLTLTLDVRLQQIALQAMNEMPGAAVAINPTTGEVLAMVSNPSFDPNVFVNGITNALYQQLQYHSNHALLNRVITGQYPPASTIKPLLALAGLETQFTTPEYSIYDTGTYQLTKTGRSYRDSKPKGHGHTNLHKAIRESCDVYFYGLAHKMGIDLIHTWLDYFGFGQATGIDLPNEKIGVNPSKQWKYKKQGKSWYPGETLSAGIGQGYILTTPLQLAVGVATLANEGYRVKPYLVKNSLTTRKAPKKTVNASASHWQIIKAAMQAVIQEPGGTAHRLFYRSHFPISAKTGTAQIFKIKQKERYEKDKVAAHLRDHSLFIAFAPSDSPKIAVAMILEHNAGSAEVAHKIIEGYLMHHVS